jgi:hypothetical protein
MSDHTCAARVKHIDLEFVAAKGLYRQMIGYHVPDPTKLDPKTGLPRREKKRVWLGRDQAAALCMARYFDDWRAGREARDANWVWSDDEVAECKRAMDHGRCIVDAVVDRARQQLRIAERVAAEVTPGLPVSAVIAPNPAAARVVTPAGAAAAPTASKAPPAATLYGALDSYVHAVNRKRLSLPYRRRIGESIEAFKHYAADRDAVTRLRGDPKALKSYLQDPDASAAYRRDFPLRPDVDRLWLEGVCDYVRSRPLSRKVNKRTGRREPVDPYTVKTVLQHAWQAFNWIDSASDGDRFGGWELPKKAKAIFAVELKKLMSKGERDRHADGPDHLTVAEIVKLYRAIDAGNVLYKIILLMGVFTAQGQTELSCAMRGEFDLEAGRFRHRRNKTGQLGEYWLPPELVAMLREYFAAVASDRDGTAFFTADGRKLVTDTSDAVRQAFDDWRERARRGVSFYACRRLLGDLAKRAGGKELRDAALSHTGSDVGDVSYSNFRDFEALARVARRLHTAVSEAGLFSTSGINAK